MDKGRSACACWRLGMYCRNPAHLLKTERIEFGGKNDTFQEN